MGLSREERKFLDENAAKVVNVSLKMIDAVQKSFNATIERIAEMERRNDETLRKYPSNIAAAEERLSSQVTEVEKRFAKQLEEIAERYDTHVEHISHLIGAFHEQLYKEMLASFENHKIWNRIKARLKRNKP